METPIWESVAIHTDGHVCADVKAYPGKVKLGQLHGEHDSFASDLHLSPESADAIAYALLEGASQARAAQR